MYSSGRRSKLVVRQRLWQRGQKSGQGRGKTSAGDDLQGALQAMKTDDHDPDVSLKTLFGSCTSFLVQRLRSRCLFRVRVA